MTLKIFCTSIGKMVNLKKYILCDGHGFKFQSQFKSYPSKNNRPLMNTSQQVSKYYFFSPFRLIYSISAVIFEEAIRYINTVCKSTTSRIFGLKGSTTKQHPQLGICSFFYFIFEVIDNSDKSNSKSKSITKFHCIFN